MLINPNTHDYNKFDVKRYIHMQLIEYIIFLVVRGLQIALSVIIPYYLAICIDQIISGQNRLSLQYFVLWFFVLAVIEFVLSCIVNELNVRLSNKITFQIEFDTLKHIKYVPYSIIQKYDDAYLSQRINNDSVTIGDYVVEKLPFFITDSALILAIIPLVFFINNFVGILLVSFIALFFIIYFTTRKMLYNRGKIMQEAQSNFFAMLSNQFFNMLTIKINAWYEETNSEFIKVVTSFFEKSVKFLRVNLAITSSNFLLSRIAYGCAILLLGNAVSKGSVTVGVLPTIVIYVQLILSKLQNITEFGKNRERYKIARDRISELCSLEREKNGSIELKRIKSISTKDLGVKYSGNYVFSGINTTFIKGRIYLLWGENGSGKTTFINTLLGVLDAVSGSILYNNQDIRKINMYTTRKKLFAVTSQEPVLQNGTLYENLTYGLSNLAISVEDAECVKLLLPFINKLEQGFNTMVGSKNISLSGGEKQKIAICRSLLKNADVLIFDEPTSALDVESTEIFLSLLENLKTDHIIIIISHDEKVASIADEIIRF